MTAQEYANAISWIALIVLAIVGFVFLMSVRYGKSHRAFALETLKRHRQTPTTQPAGGVPPAQPVPPTAAGRVTAPPKKNFWTQWWGVGGLVLFTIPLVFLSWWVYTHFGFGFLLEFLAWMTAAAIAAYGIYRIVEEGKGGWAKLIAYLFIAAIFITAIFGWQFTVGIGRILRSIDISSGVVVSDADAEIGEPITELPLLKDRKVTVKKGALLRFRGAGKIELWDSDTGQCLDIRPESPHIRIPREDGVKVIEEHGGALIYDHSWSGDAVVTTLRIAEGRTETITVITLPIGTDWCRAIGT